ncbi:unnamed protein product [Rangifer tarandus platyrhynchus]|uniref:Uncharacterized protein n=1 Tax=Rangifer tarandus platyrhynchus TaxID=3082113 RepID=A0ABN8YQ54_RANTA|nr:unnamed protein product [Rangifer tarandus platyrhynchus]
MRASCCSLDISDRVSPLPRALSIAYSLQPLLSGELGTVHSQCHTQSKRTVHAVSNWPVTSLAMKSVHFSAAELKLLKYTSAANIQKAGTNPKAKLGRQEGGEEKMEGSEGGRALLGAQRHSEALAPGRSQAEPGVPANPARPSPTGPRSKGSSAETRSTCPRLPAGGADRRGGRPHSPGTQRPRPPPEGGGARRSGGLGGSGDGEFQRHRSPELTHRPGRPSPHLPLPPGL